MKERPKENKKIVSRKERTVTNERKRHENASTFLDYYMNIICMLNLLKLEELLCSSMYVPHDDEKECPLVCAPSTVTCGCAFQVTVSTSFLPLSAPALQSSG